MTFLLMRPFVQDPRLCQKSAPDFVVENTSLSRNVTGGLGVELKHCVNNWFSVIEVMVMSVIMFLVVAYKANMLLYVSMARVLRSDQ